MLEWFIDANLAATTLKNPDHLLDEVNVEVHPENIPDAVLDENVDIHLIRRFFTVDGWHLLTEVVQQKRNKPVFICRTCSHNLDESSSIVCDHCLLWSHLKCVGLKDRPKTKFWYCRNCYDSSSF